MDKEDIIALWKELEVVDVEFNFDCGGDSMGYTEIIIKTSKGVIENEQLHSYFEDEVYENVEFYENSDGHYQGEFGTVYISLKDDEFIYEKVAKLEFNEEVSAKVSVPLTQEEIDFINKFVVSVFGSKYQSTIYNYKTDFILTDHFEKIQDSISSKIISLYDISLFKVKEGVEIDPFEDGYSFVSEGSTLIENNNLCVEFRIRTVRYENSY